jgi:coenzyme F420-reducing hydrogenase beta subunit
MMMKKIGIITFHKAKNYGAVLQAYALQKYLISKGMNAEIIDYYGSVYDHYKLQERGNLLSKSITKIQNSNLKKTYQKFESFENTFLEKSSKFYSKETISFCQNEYDYFITGSDQVWNPHIVGDDGTFLLDFVKDKKRCISYAASIGVEYLISSEKKWLFDGVNEYLQLSIREESGKRILSEVGLPNSTLVCDPSLLLDQEEYRKIEVAVQVPTKYILVFSFGNDIELWHQAKVVAEQLGAEIISVNDKISKLKDITSLHGIGPQEWLYLIDNAECIFTNSYHAMMYSIIFRKNFWIADPKDGTNCRMEELLRYIGCQRRLLTSVDHVNLQEDIDYDQIEAPLNEFISNSKKFLISALCEDKKLEYKSDFIFEIKRKEKALIIDKQCTGCTACIGSCPVGAIEISHDAKGSLFPLINEEKCIDCGKCKSICPNYTRETENDFQQKCYGLKNTDFRERFNSSSGGAYILFAKAILNYDGIVYGVKYDGIIPCYGRADNIQDAAEFMKTKYVEISKAEIYEQIRKDLKQGRKVLFTGTPCSVQGLKNYVGPVLSKNLYTIDIICHGVPVPIIYENYTKFLERKYHSKITKFDFRDKVYNEVIHTHTHTQKIRAEFANGKVYHGTQKKDPYYRLFWSNNILRECCYQCKYARMKRSGDITIGDWWGNRDVSSEFFSDGAESSVLVNSQKGNELFEQIINQADVIAVSVDDISQRNLHAATPRNPKYNAFWADFSTKSFKYVLVRRADYYGILSKFGRLKGIIKR